MSKPVSDLACVLLVVDPPRIDELVSVLAEPLPQQAAPVEVLISSGGDDTIDLFEARHPSVVVVTATLEAGDTKALVDALRASAPRAEVAIVLIGDETGPIRTAIDALEISPDRFVTSPVAGNALRFAVGSALEAVTFARGAGPRTTTTDVPAPGTPEPLADHDPTASQAFGDRAAQRARWEALADSFVGSVEILEESELRPDPGEDADPLPPPILIKLRRSVDGQMDAQVAPIDVWQPGTTSELREPRASRPPWTAPEPPAREPTLIIPDPEPSSPGAPPRARTSPSVVTPEPEPERSVDPWAGARPLAELVDRDPPSAASSARAGGDDHDELGLQLDDFDDDLVVGHETARRTHSAPRIQVMGEGGHGLGEEIARAVSEDPAEDVSDELIEDIASEEPTIPPVDLRAPVTSVQAPDGRDFARQLRAKMSMMAQRLFQGGDAASSPAVDVGPRHDHHTEIDLTSLGEEPALDRGNTEIEARAAHRTGELREQVTSPGSWDTQIRERGLPDTGELMRGLSDAAMLLAKMFAQASTGRITFRHDGVEKVVFFDQGRPVFASSSEPRDRMGELLVREGKITAAQYERCQAVVAESGRRMGEILVDFGYLKRRELLPAVRRHVEDIVYSLFSWDRGTYQISIDVTPSAERIRLSRHPAALILEGVRRKLDRTSLERLIGSPSTVIEVPDRERLGGIINLGDLAVEERGALAAFDGQADLSAVARIAGVDVTDVLPLAWGLCVLGLATARRTDTEVPDENTALVGETDLAIDRERVRARWELVSEADYFALLGVRRDATAFEIRRAYQAARRDFAADCFPGDLRRELARELDDIAHVLDEAFRVLRDDRLRLTYLSNLVD